MKLQDAYPFLAHADEPFIHRRGGLGRLAQFGRLQLPHHLSDLSGPAYNTMVATLGIS